MQRESKPKKNQITRRVEKCLTRASYACTIYLGSQIRKRPRVITSPCADALCGLDSRTSFGHAIAGMNLRSQRRPSCS
jgi:hypothetical protein